MLIRCGAAWNNVISVSYTHLPFPIMVKDIQNSFRYYYWNKESELQSGIKREEAIGCTDYEIYGEAVSYTHLDVYKRQAYN